MGLYGTIGTMSKAPVVPEWSGTPRTWMRTWRAYWDLTQAEAAELAMIHRKTWQRWEKGTRPMPYREYQRITELLKLSPEDIRLNRELDEQLPLPDLVERSPSENPSRWWSRSLSDNIRREVEGKTDGDQ